MFHTELQQLLSFHRLPILRFLHPSGRFSSTRPIPSRSRIPGTSQLPHIPKIHKSTKAGFERRRNAQIMARNVTTGTLDMDFEDRFSPRNTRGGGGGRGGRRGGAGGGKGQGREVQISKALSRILRHQAERAGIKLDESGYAELDKVLNWGDLKRLNVTLEEVKAIVESNDKQRFSLMARSPDTGTSEAASSIDPANFLIRANQGHTIKVEATNLLTPIKLPTSPDDPPLPETVLHGTFFHFWPTIVSSGGLKPMGRNHVHFSRGLPETDEGVISGMRKDAELLIYVDIEAALRDGMEWWKSDNGVILTSGIADPTEERDQGPRGDEAQPSSRAEKGKDNEKATEADDPGKSESPKGLVSSKYFKLVVGRKQDVGTLVKDGEKVADLPKGVKGKVPHGKERAAGMGRGGRGRGGKREV